MKQLSLIVATVLGCGAVCGLFAGESPDKAIATERLSASLLAERDLLQVDVTELGPGNYELRIATDGLKNVETGADVNEPGEIYLPAPAVPAPRAENVFFFNDLLVADGWKLMVNFASGITGRWKLNGRFSPCGGALESQLAISVSELEHGENLLHFQSTILDVPQMYYCRQVMAQNGKFSTVLQVARRDWSGRVTLYRLADGAGAALVRTVDVAGPELTAHPLEIPERWWEDRQRVTASALAVGRNLLHSQVQRKGSLFQGGFNLVYDPSHKSYRMPHWLWAWGPSISLLLDLSKLEAAKADGLAEKFHVAALAAAERSLDFEMKDPRNPAFGVSTVRWEPSRQTPLGWAEYVSTADSLFMAGWGWMSAYQVTKQPVYLARMQSLVAAAERLMAQYPVIPQDWIVERNRWTPHTLDESVFGTIGFRRLFEETGSAQVAAAGRRFLDSHLDHMGRPSGMLARAWLREEDKGIWDADIKGHAWVIEGYLDAHRLSGDRKYLELARQLAERVMAYQGDDGGWTYLFKRPGPEDMIDDKGTAIWAYLFYDLYKTTWDLKYLTAGRQALGWCLRHQWRGNDAQFDGAIVNPNGMAYVRRRPMTILYTTTFFGLALLEELGLTADSP